MNDEDSRLQFGASIGGDAERASLLLRACHDASHAPRDRAIDIVLQHLREAVGAERAFLVEATRPVGRPSVVASSMSGRGDATAFSTSVAARALRGERPLFFADVRRAPVWAEGMSVRSLGLRGVIAVPVRSSGRARAAVVLDSRVPLALDAQAGNGLVEAFAGLLSLLRRVAPSELEQADPPAFGQVSSSPAFLLLQDDVRRAARMPLPALILGESGSGKELVARALHEGGRGRQRPFVAINCAAIPESLLERELFGATRGAFTGADRDHVGLFRQAEGGTVFLDEIGDMPLLLQAKLLRVLQEGAVRAVGALEERPIDVRVIAATHRDLDTLVAENTFRADLRFRLEVLVLRVPPLRERLDDLPALSECLIARLASRCGLPQARLEPEATDRLAQHTWPGNVRELESVLARALLRHGDGVIRASDLDLPSEIVATGSRRSRAKPPGLEIAMIEEAVRTARGNLTAAALRIGWTRQTLYRRIHALGLSRGTKSSQSSTFQ